jgi:Icc protein
MKLIHITDPHVSAPGKRVWGLDPIRRLERCLEDVVAYHSDARACIITGDLSDDGTEASYRALAECLGSFPLPTRLLVGNHDKREVFAAVFGDEQRDAEGFIQGSLDLQDHRLLFLDTVKDAPTSAGAYCARRRAWLKDRLETAEGRSALIFMHHPPFDIGHALMDLIKLEEPDDFHAVVRGHDVKHLFFGHAHRAISGQWRGIPFSALPSLNHQLPLVGGSVATVYSEEPAMYGVAMIEADRTVVHMDAFLDRRPAQMEEVAERGNWY